MRLILLSLCLIPILLPAQEVTIRTVPVRGQAFNCRVAGDSTAPAVILLHGWPETGRLWTPLIERLAAAGYYCIAPDQRGFSPGARPRGRKHYVIDTLARDVFDLADALGIRRFHLVGHDWGAAIAWYATKLDEGRIRSLSAMSVPHVQAFGEAIMHDPDQHRRSYYMRQFQIPIAPEWILKRRSFRTLKSIWTESSAEEVSAYLAVFSARGAMKATLNYYRANYPLLKRSKKAPMLGEISHPVLFIWGNRDEAVGPAGVEMTHKYMRGPYTFLDLDAGHWLVQEKFTEVLQALWEHLLKYP